MAMTANITRAMAKLNRAKQDIHPRIVQSLIKAGQQIVTIARNTKTYTDQTGNLTASIGYGIFDKGTLINTGGFIQGEGKKQGLQRLSEIAPKIPNNAISLIIIAGMDYAIYVERSGYTILDPARHATPTIINNLLRQLQK